MNAHENRQTTPEELQKDAIGIADQVFLAWDGQVDIVVVLVPRARPKEAYMGSTVTNPSLIKQIAEAIRQKAPYLVNLRGRG